MTRLRDWSVRRKLILLGIAAGVIALLVSTSFVLYRASAAIRDEVRREIEVQATIAADNTTAPLAFRDVDAATQTLGALRLVSSIDMACLYDDTGTHFASYVSPRAGGTCAPTLDTARAAIGPSGRVVEVAEPGRKVGTLVVAGNLNRVRRRVTDEALAAAAGMLLGIGAAVLLAIRLQRMVSRPIEDLSQTADRISQTGDYRLRAQPSGADEIGQLVDRFNSMVAEIERRDDELRASGRLKDEFLAALSHELRTPLNAVLGWSHVLRRPGIAPDMLERGLDSIERNARLQARLVEDLLDISRIVTGKLRLTFDRVDLVAVLDAALEVVQPGAAAKGVTVRRLVPPGTLWVRGDADRLQQVIWNLLSNAVKFTPAGGEIDVSVRLEGTVYRIDVRDTGIGISPGFLPHVFDRFRQADGSMARQHGGLGLGLAIAFELTQLHGGQLTATSEGPNAGSVFSLTLPVAPSLTRTSPAPGAGDAGRGLAGVVILIVDDDGDSRDLARMALESAGATVGVAASAAEALAHLRDRVVDALVCDLAMPGMTGFELLQRWRAEERRARPGDAATAAIAVSAHAGEERRAEVVAAGFDRYVAKPYEASTLVAAVADAITVRAAT